MSKLIDLTGLKVFLGELKNLFVLKEEGKGLSERNYTEAEKTKLANLHNYDLPTASDSTLGGVKIGDGLKIANGVISTIPQDLSNYAKKSDIAKAVNYRGSVDSYSALPSSGMAVGDMYNIVGKDDAHGIKAGDNVVYNGNTWDNVGGTMDLSAYATKDDVKKAVLGGIQIATEPEVKQVF